MLIDLHMRKLGYSASDMQAMLCVSMSDMKELYGIKPSGPSLRVVP